MWYNVEWERLLWVCRGFKVFGQDSKVFGTGFSRDRDTFQMTVFLGFLYYER